MTEQEIENAIRILRDGKDGKFWQLMCDALDDSIAHLRKEQDGTDINSLPADEYTAMAELLKAKQKYLAHLKGLPDFLINDLSEPAGNVEEEENPDPYD